MSIEAMKQALEALENHAPIVAGREIKALRTAIQQAEAQQPATPDPMLSTDIAPRPLSYSLDDYHRAPSEGALHYTWQDKPHRLLYDLIAAVAYYTGKQPATGEPAATKHEAMASALAQLRDAHRCNMAELRPTEVHRICVEALEVAKRTTPEPGVWMASYVDPVGNDHVYVTSHRDLAVENDMHGEPKPLYTRPAPSGLGDSKRLDYLQDRGATIDLIAGVAAFYPMRFRVGGLHSSANIDVRAAIDAAMLAAK